MIVIEVGRFVSFSRVYPPCQWKTAPRKPIAIQPDDQKICKTVVANLSILEQQNPDLAVQFRIILREF